MHIIIKSTTPRTQHVYLMIVRRRLPAENSRRYPGDGCSWRDVPHDHRSSSDRRSRPHLHSAQERSVPSNRCSPADMGALQCPIGSPLGTPVCRGRSWMSVVREHDAMTDENLVLNRYALAYETVRRYLAARAHFRPDLDFDESTDPGL